MSSLFLQSQDFRQRLRFELLFYERFIKAFGESPSDTEMDSMIKEYNNFIFHFATQSKCTNIPLHVKVIWRIHLKHPKIYRRDCFQHFGKLILPKDSLFEFNDTCARKMDIPCSTQQMMITQLDLKNALLTHLDLMKKIYDHDFWSIEQNIDNAIMEYVHFMKLVGYNISNQNVMRPSIYADFIWYIHMLDPKNYTKESQILANGNIASRYDNNTINDDKWQNIFRKSKYKCKRWYFGALITLLFAVLVSVYKLYEMNEEFSINSNRRRLIGRYSGTLFMFLIILFIMGIITIVFYCDAYFVDIDPYTSGGCGGNCSSGGGGGE